MAKKSKKQKKQKKIFNKYYHLYRTLARITHANINIKGGNYFQAEVYEAIVASQKHKKVTQEHVLPLKSPTKKRKEHHIDILIVEDDYALAINSKGKSFNNTKSEDSELDEYLWYMSALEREYPGKKVSYIIFKDEYDPSDSKMNAYHYLNKNGISVYNTEEYMISNYNTDFDALEKRRQDRCVLECERVLLEEGFDLKKLHESYNQI
jgi:hypothetical protein